MAGSDPESMITNPVATATTGTERRDSASGPMPLDAADRTMSTVSLPPMLLERQHAAGGCTRYRKAVAIGLVVAALAVVGIVLGIVLGLPDHRTTKINVPDTFSANFRLASKTGGPSGAYTGSMYKTTNADGTWSWQFYVKSVSSANSTHRVEYILIDGHAYVQRVALATGNVDATWCMRPEDMLPLQDVQTLLMQATPVPNAEFNQNAVSDCAGEGTTKYVLQWGTPTYRSENSFVYCSSGSDRHTLVGDQFLATAFDINLTPASSGLGVSVPKNLTTGQPLSCPLLSIPSVLPSQPQRRLAAAAAYAAANAWWAYDAAAAASPMRRLTGSYTCIFVHGASVTNDDTVATSFSSYWGDVHTRVLGKCGTLKFLRRNMKSVSWQSSNLQTYFCSKAAVNGVVPASTIIFSHQAGSLLVAAALDNNICSFASGVKWYAIGSPFTGSPFASNANNLCSTEQNALGAYFTAEGACSGTSVSTDMAQMTYGNVPSSVRNEYLSKATGYMCGTDSYGLYVSGVSDMLSSITDYVSFGFTPHDGFVKTTSCEAGTSGSGFVWWQPKYYPAVNHIDATCRAGNANIDVLGNKSPCSWFAKIAE